MIDALGGAIAGVINIVAAFFIVVVLVIGWAIFAFIPAIVISALAGGSLATGYGVCAVCTVILLASYLKG